MKKKILSMLVALCMLISAMPAFAFFADNVTIPETSVLCYYDFEKFAASASTNIAFTEQSNYGGPMYYANGFVLEADNNKYFIHSGANFMYGVRERVNGNKDAISSGVLKLEYKVKIPTPASATYADIFFATFNPAEGDGARAYFNTPAATADGAVIHFANAIHDGAKVGPSENAVTKEVNYDQWYTITMIVDYDNNKVFQFLDGKRVAAYSQTEENFNKFHSFNYGGLSKGTAAATTSESIQMDNFLVERLDSADVTAKVVNVGANYVDVEFDASLIANDSFVASNFAAKKLDGSDAVSAQTVTMTEVDKIRVEFADNFAAGSNYELIVNADVVEAGTNLTMAKGTKLMFATAAASSAQTLIDLNFNDKENHFATAENSADFNTYYYQSASSTDTSTAFVTQKDLTDDYATVTSRGDGETGSNFRILQFKHSPTEADYQSLVFPFANNASVKSGKITIEFEAMLEGTAGTVGGAFETAYGLRDTKNTATAFDYTSTWADATVFAGHETWSGHQKDLTPALVGKRGKPSTWYGGPNVVEGSQASDWLAAHRLVQLNYTGKTNTTVMDKYKIVVDLDNDIFEIYFNDVLKYTSTYMPGGINDGEYDAFVLTTVHGNSSLYNYFYMDNLKVTREGAAEEVLTIDSAAFEVEDETVAYNSEVAFDTNKMTITMSEEVGAVNKELVKLSGSDDYTVSASGNVITLEFANGLTCGENYTVTLSKDLAAASGAKVGADTVLSFTTNAGKVTYTLPVVTVNGAAPETGAVAANDAIVVSVGAKAGAPCTATIVIAAYKGDTLADVAYDVVTSSTGTLVYEYSASENFAGADVIKAFVLDNLDDITPYTASYSVGE